MNPIIRVPAAAALLTLSVVFSGLSVHAQDTKPDVSEAEAVKKSLEKLTGKTATLRLHAGEDISGVVERVGPTAVQIGQLTGKEFFSAIVKLDEIAAIIYRSK